MKTKEEIISEIDDLAALSDFRALHKIAAEAAENDRWDLANAYQARGCAVEARLAGNIQRALKMEQSSESYLENLKEPED